MCNGTEKWWKFSRGIDLLFKNWHNEFDKLWLKHLSLKNLHFNGLLLTKVYNVWAKNVQGSYISWHERVMQNLKKKWLVV